MGGNNGKGRIIDPNEQQTVVVQQVAAPLNDYQVVSVMAAVLLSGQPVPDREDTKSRNEQASYAVRRALDVLGHAAYQTGLGEVAGVINSGMAMGKEHAAAIADEAAQPPGGDRNTGQEPPADPSAGTGPKLITDL